MRIISRFEYHEYLTLDILCSRVKKCKLRVSMNITIFRESVNIDSLNMKIEFVMDEHAMITCVPSLTVKP